MGEAAGLDQLAEVAPVIGVRGQDDSDDPRTDSELLVLAGDDVTVGCVFDAVGAGLATSNDPFTPAADFAAAAERVFGRPIDVLLVASTHRPAQSQAAARCSIPAAPSCRARAPGARSAASASKRAPPSCDWPTSTRRLRPPARNPAKPGFAGRHLACMTAP
jgi:hypothetical protein